MFIAAAACRLKTCIDNPRTLLVAILCLFVGACTQAPLAPPPLDVNLIQSQVLKVIRENPQLIVETLTQYQQEQAAAQQKAADDALRAQIAQLDLPALIGDSPTLGNPARKVLLFELSDFQCPYCGRAADTLRKFVEKHRDEVTLIYKHLPLTEMHPEAERAARAAWAAGRQGKFWEYHDALFAQQQNLSEKTYGAIATALRLDLKKFNADRRSDAAEISLRRDLALASKLKISGTPAFLMQHEPFAGALPLEALEEILQRVKSQPNVPAATEPGRDRTPEAVIVPKFEDVLTQPSS